MEMATRYDPKKAEQRWYDFWETQGCFRAEVEPAKDPYTVMIPPPNVTAILHMGQAFCMSFQDILIRFWRMRGRSALWLPGVDHAGIATQNVVERLLAKEGKSRNDLGREAFVEKVWEWKNKYGDTIIQQLRRMGFSCDWSRERFTMDDGLSKAVYVAFEKLYKDGLIFRGKYIVNWCPRCRTALADDEVEHKDSDGKLWHIRYPLKDQSGDLVVATTRPETMLGDTAIAVSPKDPRYKKLVGSHALLPILGRELVIVADIAVDAEFGTGAVKVTPAHDPNDFQIGLRHDLEQIIVMDESAQMNEQAGKYNGMDRYQCRKAIVADLEADGLIEKIEPHKHAVGRCYRCDTVIEPYLSDQWFVDMKPMAQKAIEATKSGKVRFHPERWSGYYLSWLENVRPWCISRQIWWGHRIPVYTCDDCGELVVAATTPDACGKCGGKSLPQDTDVLDTWFSSALWPFSTLGWPEKTDDLAYFYPTSTLVTDRSIIFFWVARMVMMGLELMDDVPFSDVFINGTICDDTGRKMSKSLGNGIDPLEMIDQYGADAIRYSLMTLTSEGQDVKLPETKFEMGRNFANKVWNASRFCIMNLEGKAVTATVPDSGLQPEDEWILNRLNHAIESLTESLEQFRFNEAAQTIYAFIWHELCDWYIERAKPRLLAPTHEDDPARAVMAHVLDKALRLLHPFMPFLTEEVWQTLKEAVSLGADPGKALMVADWPQADPRFADDARVQGVYDAIALCSAIRRMKKEKGLPESKQPAVRLSAPSEAACQRIGAQEEFIITMARVASLAIGTGLTAEEDEVVELVGEYQLLISLEGMIDKEAEAARLTRQLEQAKGHLASATDRLANESFTARAPEAVVQKARQRKAELEEQVEKLKATLKELS